MSSTPYKTPTLPIEARADDLIARMTLDEKIAQLGRLWSTPMLTADGIASSFAPEPDGKMCGVIRCRMLAVGPPLREAIEVDVKPTGTEIV